MKRSKYVIFLCLLPYFVGGQEVYDLKQCLEKGLDRNFDIRIVRNEQLISENNNTIGNAGYLPTLDLNAGYTGTINNIKQNLTTGETNELTGIHNPVLNAGVALNWTVFDGFQIQTKHARLKELQQMGELNTRLVIEDLISKLTAEYFNYVRQIIRLSNLKYAVSLSKERLRIAEEQYNIGSRSRLDMQQARVDLNADSSNCIRQQESLYTSRINLNQLMALDDVTQPLTIGDSIIVPNNFLKGDEIQQKTLQSNTQLLLADKNRYVSELDYKSLKGRDYPYLKLNAGYGYTQNWYDAGSYDKQRTTGFNYGLTLGYNIFDGFNRKREQKNAKIVIQNRELQYSQLELSVKSDLANIWMAYENNLELTNLEKENLETARDNYGIALERYKLGDLSGIELREAQNSLLSAEERLLTARYNTKLCEISLLQISGQITNYLE